VAPDAESGMLEIKWCNRRGAKDNSWGSNGEQAGDIAKGIYTPSNNPRESSNTFAISEMMMEVPEDNCAAQSLSAD